MDDNPQIVTKSEDSQKNLEERLLRGRLDQQVSRYRRIRIPRERSIAETGAMTQVKTCGAVERPKQSLELVDRVTQQEAKKGTRSRMNRHRKIRFPEIEGGQPVPLTY